MSHLRKLARVVCGAALGVALAVTTSQVLTDNGVSWAWLYVSLAVAVLAALLATPAAPAPRTATGRRGVYLRQLRASVEEMEIVGIVTQSEFVLRTREVYVDVSLARRPRHETAGEPYVGTVPTPAAGERRTLRSFLTGDASRVLAVIGGPGTGKTTLARRTALDLCASPWWRFWDRASLPILLYLRDHREIAEAEQPPSLAEAAASAGWLHDRVPATWLDRRLDGGGCVVLLDGLDEVADEAQRGRVVAWVKRQVERYPHNRYVVTSRPHGYDTNPLPSAEVLQVRRFTGEQIRRFLHGWEYATERRATESAEARVREVAARKAEDLLGRLRDRPALYDLAANPLLLTMIANVHRYRGQLPGSRAALYGEMCDVLLHRRAESRNLANATGLRGPQKERVMRHLALAMMTSRVRDIPSEAAHRAIRGPLRQVSRDVESGTFLEEARRSGLLVEREQGVYAFAHLTMQEYLAAAQIGQRPEHVQLLTDHVDDPWWRETTLLWAATADASPVIDACLAAGTVRALALAFDCAEEAEAVDHALRARLDELLASPETRDPDRRRLVAGVTAARSLRETIPVGDAALCARPVSGGLYALFAREEQEAGRQAPAGYRTDARHSGGPAADAPAVGMWAGDAERFVSWLNDLFHGETTYRLPTAEELADAAVDLVVPDRTRHTVWMSSDGRGPRLYQPDGAPWPYTPDPSGLSRRLVDDRSRATPYLRLALMDRPDLERAVKYWSVFSVALHRAPEFATNPELRPLELALVLALARTLAHALARTNDLTLALTFARALTHALDHAHDLARTLAHALTPALTHAHALARALTHDLDHAHDLNLDRVLDLDRFLDRFLDHDHSLDLALAHALALDHAHAFDLALALDLAQGHDHARALTHDLDHALNLNLDHALDYALDRDRAFGLALDLAPEADAEPLSIAVVGFRLLLTRWRPSIRGRKGLLTDFDASLSRIVSEAPQPAALPSESPLVPIRRVRDLLGSQLNGAHVDPRLVDARFLVDRVHELITPFLGRTSPVDPTHLACARIGLLAAITLLRESGHEGAEPLVGALLGLIALQERADGVLAPNELLLLVRA
ncbi:NACHT domain-containing protein [Streptomyces sp. 4N509B]|uniref:NACHT domain-containing protein n=1 Tax=Streptomyces sp. 4N509B TaxID=3457413 RepID=UPI003FD04595